MSTWFKPHSSRRRSVAAPGGHFLPLCPPTPSSKSSITFSWWKKHVEQERNTHSRRERKRDLLIHRGREKYSYSRRGVLYKRKRRNSYTAGEKYYTAWERERRAVYRKAEINKSSMEILPYPSLPTHVVERGRSTHGEKKACFAFVNHPLSEKELHTGTLHTHKSKQPDGKKCKG